MTEDQFIALLHGFRQQTLTAEELQAFLEKAGDPAFEALLGEQLVRDLSGYQAAAAVDEEQLQSAWKSLREKRKPAGTAVIRRLPFVRRWGWAAAVVLLLGAATYFLVVRRWAEAGNPPVGTGTVAATTDLLPAGNRAVLTLADGSTITLDSAANGRLAEEGGARIVKLADGQLSYMTDPASGGKTGGEMLYNTMSTPRGSQYQLTLPDGTRVWLNAASSITYPTAFTGPQRRVKIRGEAYFEVQKNRAQPFLVDAGGRSSVEVLGTAFNVNAYDNEQSVVSTLLEGSVQVSREAGGTGNAGQPADKVVLLPGSQARVKETGKILVLKEVDKEKVMAWKNGLFNFQNAQLEEVMREIARWYDIEVVYEQGIPQVEFMGKIGRNLTLGQVLNGLKGTGFHFRLEAGRKLVILP